MNILYQVQILCPNAKSQSKWRDFMTPKTTLGYAKSAYECTGLDFEYQIVKIETTVERSVI